MKFTQQQLLCNMIKSYELRRQNELQDDSFDGFVDLANFLGHKSYTTLRKWCGPESSRINTKLGFEDAMKLMDHMNDYRLIDFMRESLIERKNEVKQLKLFSEPKSEL